MPRNTWRFQRGKTEEIGPGYWIWAEYEDLQVSNMGIENAAESFEPSWTNTSCWVMLAEGEKFL